MCARGWVQAVDTLLVDPNVLYVLLIGSLWLAAIAVTVPGTGALELLAIGLSAVTVLLLTRLETRWVAVIAIGLSAFGSQILPFIRPQPSHRPIMWGALALQVVASLFLFQNVMVSPAVIAVLALISLLYQRFIITPARLAQQLAPAMLEDAPLVGQHGYAQRDIDPVGVVRVRGENWTARSDEAIGQGERIVVVEQDGLTLFVRPEKRKRPQHHTESEEV